MYYYRSVRDGRRVRSQYIGTGEAAVLIAQLEAIERERRETNRQTERAERQAVDKLEARFAGWFDRVEALAREALTAAGYHQHKRGEWRKRRGTSPTEQATDSGGVQGAMQEGRQG
jgi:hypothetical protein